MEFERLANAIAEVLDIDASKITPDSKFVEDLGADSLDVLEIVMGIESEFGIKIPTEATENIVTAKKRHRHHFWRIPVQSRIVKTKIIKEYNFRRDYES